MPTFTNISIAPPSADETFTALPGKHGFYLKPFTGGTPVTTFVEGDNYADLIVGALPFTSAAEAAELIMLSGRRLRGDRTVTAENQTPRMQIYRGQAKFTILFDRMITRAKEADAPTTIGEALAFARTYPDDNAVVGVLYVENMVAEGDPGADAFGYDVELSFSNEFYWADVSAPPV